MIRIIDGTGSEKLLGGPSLELHADRVGAGLHGYRLGLPIHAPQQGSVILQAAGEGGVLCC